MVCKPTPSELKGPVKGDVQPRALLHLLPSRKVSQAACMPFHREDRSGGGGCCLPDMLGLSRSRGVERGPVTGPGQQAVSRSVEELAQGLPAVLCCGDKMVEPQSPAVGLVSCRPRDNDPNRRTGRGPSSREQESSICRGGSTDVTGTLRFSCLPRPVLLFLSTEKRKF